MKKFICHENSYASKNFGMQNTDQMQISNNMI